MTSKFDRRSVLKLGGSLMAATALTPQLAFGQAASINYWHHFTSQTEFAGLDAVLKKFAEAHPDIAVTQENIPNPEFMAKVTGAVVAKSVPDTTMIAAERVADLTAMNALVDLTDRINAWPEKANFPDDRWTAITVDGKIYGIPAFTFVDWMYYRKDWFDEAGLAAPTNYVEMTEAAKKLTDAGNSRFGFGMRGGAGGAKYVIDVMEAFGAPIIGADGTVGLDRAAAMEAMTWYTGLHTTEKVTPPSTPNDGFRQIMEAFQTGQTAMLWHHTGSLLDQTKFLTQNEQFATAPMPAGPAARIARLSYAYNGLMKTDNADAAFAWVAYWGGADAAVAFLEQTGYFPASPQVAADQRIASNPIYAAAVETLGFGRLPPSVAGLAGWSDNIALPAFQRVLIGEASVEAAVDEMIAGLEANVA